MLRLTTLIQLSLVWLLCACSSVTPPVSTQTSAADLGGVPYRAALFESNPDDMHRAFRAACDSPGDVFLQPDTKTDLCRFLPSPQLAAYLLTEYDASLEVPYVFIQKETLSQKSGVEIRISYFAEITAKSGRTQRIYKPTRLLDQRIDRLLQSAGGELQ